MEIIFKSVLIFVKFKNDPTNPIKRGGKKEEEKKKKKKEKKRKKVTLFKTLYMDYLIYFSFRT